MKKTKLAINNLFASNKHNGQNNVVLLHELLHTLGATDKYDLATGIPFFQQGFANSNQLPIYPQSKAEIMGGRIVISETKVQIPDSIKDVIIGPITAKEIGWIE